MMLNCLETHETSIPDGYKVTLLISSPY